MKPYKLVIVCFLVLLIAVLAAQVVLAQSGGGYDLSWNTLFPGGAAAGTGGSGHTIDSAIGQPFAGKTSGSPYELCAGYLCGVQAETMVYLPLVRK